MKKRLKMSGYPDQGRGYMFFSELVPIKSESHYDDAVAFLKKLAIRDEDSLDSGESAYLEALCFFVENYQQKHHQISIKKMSPLAALKYLMQESGMSIADLGRLLSSRSLASQILLGHRDMSKSTIVTLANHFGVDASLFLDV